MADGVTTALPDPDWSPDDRLELTEEEWRERLDADAFEILRRKGTERAFTGCYYQERTPGVYECRGCGLALFDSRQKYDSGSGWPSFFGPVKPDRVVSREDRSHGMRRVEIVCARCDGHLGHVFEDGPAPTGLRYCVNSASLRKRASEALE